MKGGWWDLSREPHVNIGPNDDLHKYWIARVEPYIDAEEKTKWELSYGRAYTELSIWYDLEEVKDFFKNWNMPATSRWANLKIWKKTEVLEPFK